MTAAPMDARFAMRQPPPAWRELDDCLDSLDELVDHAVRRRR
jgi:hypothetical protein